MSDFISGGASDNMSFFNMIEMFGGGSEGGEGIDYERMVKMMEMVMAFQSLMGRAQAYQKRKQEPPPAEDPVPVHYLRKIESRLRTPEILTIKSAVPYLEPNYQKTIRIFIKLIEIQRLMNICKEVVEIINPGFDNGSGWWFKLLSQLRAYLTPVNRMRIDALLKFMEAESMFSRIKVRK